MSISKLFDCGTTPIVLSDDGMRDLNSGEIKLRNKRINRKPSTYYFISQYNPGLLAEVAAARVQQREVQNQNVRKFA